MANKSHQMTMPDSRFNSGTIPLCHAVLSSIDFFFPFFFWDTERKKMALCCCCWFQSLSSRPSRLTQAPHSSPRVSLLFLRSHHRLWPIRNRPVAVLGWQPLRLCPRAPLPLRKHCPPPRPHLSAFSAISFAVSAARLQGHAA